MVKRYLHGFKRSWMQAKLFVNCDRKQSNLAALSAMALKIDIIEPGGEDSVVVDLEQRVDKQQRVTVGRPRGKGFPHHIPFRKAIGMISAIQMTLEIRGEGETQELWVRDGGYRDEEWRASTNKTRLNADLLRQHNGIHCAWEMFCV